MDAPAGDQPNILLILTDQQRWDSLGCYGADWIRTPNLDSLASEGARFERCYCTNPVCTPSRASLWTGRHVPGHGVYRLDDILPPDQVLFPELLRNAGYRTGLFGKLHVSGRRHEEQRRHPHDGFDEYEWALEGPLGMDSPMQSYSRWLSGQNPEAWAKLHELGRDWEHIPRNLHFTHWAADRSIDFISRAAGAQPFFCCMSVFDPHNPYEDHPMEYRDRVEIARIPRPVPDSRSTVPAGIERERRHSYLGDIDAFTAEEITEMRLGYYASIALLDDEVGRVLEALQRHGVTDNTLVIFASDHGDMLGDHRLLVKGAMFYDPGVRVPLLMKWPRHIPAGAVIATPVQPNDIAATVLAAAGAVRPWSPDEQDLVGCDLLPAVLSAAPGGEEPDRRDTPDSNNPVEWRRPGEVVCLYRNSGINKTSRDWDPPIQASMIFDGRYKLNVFHTNSKDARTIGPGRGGLDRPSGELYDLELDPLELSNLWTHPESSSVREELTERLLNWIARNEVAYLGSRGGTAIVPPDQYIVNTLSHSGGPE